MSISCYVHFKDKTRETKSIPVAAEGEFTRYWERPALSLGLNLIAQFSAGLWIHEISTISHIIDELPVLRNYWINEMKAREIEEKWRVEMVIERIDKLLNLLNGLTEKWDQVESVTF